MTGVRTLQLTSSMESFFCQQVDVLETCGVECRTLCVPGNPQGDESRSLVDYLRLYRQVLNESRNEFDLVHVNYGLLGPLGLAQPVRPVVLTLWGSELMSDSQRLDTVTRFAARRSTAVIAPSKAISERLECPHRLVPFGIDLDRFRPIDRRVARDRLGWDQNKRLVLFPYDRTRDVKNYPLARRVVDRATVDAELKTVSGRPYDEMPCVMNAVDALLVTSRRESGPMVVREAAACNVPVVSTDVGFVSETLSDVDNSYVADSEAELVDALDSVLQSGGRSDGRDAVSECSVERMKEELLSVYADLLEAPELSPHQSPHFSSA